MAYLKLDEGNQIVAATAEDGMVELMADQWSVAWVNGDEIQMWGCADEGGLIDSAQFHHPELSIGSSSDLTDEETTAATTTAVNHLKSLGKKVYHNGVEQ